MALLATYGAFCATSAHQLLCCSLCTSFFSFHHLCLVTGVEPTVTASAAVIRCLIGHAPSNCTAVIAFGVEVGLCEERNTLHSIIST